LDQQQLDQQRVLAEQELAQRAMFEEGDVERFNMDFLLRERLAEENRLLEIRQMQQQKQYEAQMLGLRALELPAQYLGSGMMPNMDALQPAMQAAGLPGLFNPQQAAGMPNLNPDQNILFNVRQQMYPQQ
jgi:hypothetical protein